MKKSIRLGLIWLGLFIGPYILFLAALILIIGKYDSYTAFLYLSLFMSYRWITSPTLAKYREIIVKEYETFKKSEHAKNDD